MTILAAAGSPMVAAAIRVRATTLAAGGLRTVGADIKAPETTSAVGGHPTVEVGPKGQATTLVVVIARTATAGSRAREAISAGDGIPMGRGRARILAVGGIRIVASTWKTFHDRLCRRNNGREYMIDISFDCPHCKQHMVASEDWAGQPVECPSCKTPLVIPLLQSPLRIDLKQAKPRSNTESSSVNSGGGDAKPDNRVHNENFGVKNTAKGAAKTITRIAQQAGMYVKTKWEDGGKAEGLKKRVRTYTSAITKGFGPAPDSKEMSTITSRVSNLWESGIIGKIVIIASCAIINLFLAVGVFRGLVHKLPAKMIGVDVANTTTHPSRGIDQRDDSYERYDASTRQSAAIAKTQRYWKELNYILVPFAAKSMNNNYTPSMEEYENIAGQLLSLDDDNVDPVLVTKTRETAEFYNSIRRLSNKTAWGATTQEDVQQMMSGLFASVELLGSWERLSEEYGVDFIDYTKNYN